MVLRKAPHVKSLRGGGFCCRGGGAPDRGETWHWLGVWGPGKKVLGAARSTTPLAQKDGLRSSQLLPRGAWTLDLREMLRLIGLQDHACLLHALPPSSNYPRSSVLSCGKWSPRPGMGSLVLLAPPRPPWVIPASEAILCRYKLFRSTYGNAQAQGGSVAAHHHIGMLNRTMTPALAVQKCCQG